MGTPARACGHWRTKEQERAGEGGTLKDSLGAGGKGGGSGPMPRRASATSRVGSHGRVWAAARLGEDYRLGLGGRGVLERGRGEGGGGKGNTVVCNLSTSLVVEDAARDCGATVVRTPVGEVHVARRIVELRAPIGGEGNGGVMYPALHVGRDAPVAAALVLALLARTGRRVSEWVAAAPRYAIVKAKLARGTRNAARGLDDVYAALRSRFPEASADMQDGLRLAWRDRWLHVRPSNTEPIIRLIAEAPSGAEAEQLVNEGRLSCAAS